MPKANLVGDAASRLGRRQISAHPRARDDRRRRLQPVRHPGARTGRPRARAKGGRLADPILRAEIARAAIDTYASEATRLRYLAEVAGGGELGARSALLKYDGTELNKRRHELMMSLAGADGLYFDGNRGPAQDVAQGWLRSKGNSIEGGTSEIMLDIVAKRLLELPAE